MSLEWALTSAPWASRRRVFSRSVAAHIRAVALASFRLLGSAPCFRSRSNVGVPVYSTAYMNGVEPSGPRALRSWGSSATDFINPCRSAARNASTEATALGFNGGSSTSLASASGQSAPWSIHVLMTLICSGRSGPVGGICMPYALPDIRWYRKLLSLLPGTTPRRLMTMLFRSSRIPLLCCDGPWQGTQFCRKMGRTSFAKSTLAGAWADNVPANTNEHSDGHRSLDSNMHPSSKIGTQESTSTGSPAALRHAGTSLRGSVPIPGIPLLNLPGPFILHHSGPSVLPPKPKFRRCCHAAARVHRQPWPTYTWSGNASMFCVRSLIRVSCIRTRSEERRVGKEG